MKFKFNDEVNIDDEFYGKIKGIVRNVSHDVEICGMDKNTGKPIHNDQCYSYLVIFNIDNEVVEKEFDEEDLN